MQPADRLELVSPEGVVLDLALGGLGSRFVAALIDTALQLTLIVALLILAALTNQGSGAYVAALASVGLFVVLIGYHVAFETLGHGRSPGKRMTGLRVTNIEGRPVRFWQSLVRNVLRIIDFLPSTYLVGAIFILVTNKNQRVGDYVGNTLVVRDARIRRKKLAVTIGEPALPADHANWDVTAIGADDLAVIRHFLDRRESFLDDARERLAIELAARYRPMVAGAPSGLSAERFLERLAAVKLSRI